MAFSSDAPKLAHYLRLWNLTADGERVVTANTCLLPTRRDGERCMLKLTSGAEARGSAVLEWWGGDGAARVIARDRGAVLLERAPGTRSLAGMSRHGQDDEACRILAAVASRLHRPRPLPAPELLPLSEQFASLAAGDPASAILCRCAETARALLADPRDVRILHGDIHHDNVLDFADRGWLAIDPKGLIGERGFDFANLFTNPDLSDATIPVATMPGRLARRLDIVAQAAGLERRRLLQWVLAWAGLSAVWILRSEGAAAVSLDIAAQAAAELDR